MKKLNSMFMDEKGSVLVIGLLILISLTLIGLAAMNTSRIETDIAGNELSYKKEFYHADAGISWAVGELTTADVTPIPAANTVFAEVDDMPAGPVPANSPFELTYLGFATGCPGGSTCAELQSDYIWQTGDRGMGMVSIVAGIELPSPSGPPPPPGYEPQY